MDPQLPEQPGQEPNAAAMIHIRGFLARITTEYLLADGTTRFNAERELRLLIRDLENVGAVRSVKKPFVNLYELFRRPGALAGFDPTEKFLLVAEYTRQLINGNGPGQEIPEEHQFFREANRRSRDKVDNMIMILQSEEAIGNYQLNCRLY